MMGNKTNMADIRLQETNKYMGVSNTIGQKMWQEQEAQPETLE